MLEGGTSRMTLFENKIFLIKNFKFIAHRILVLRLGLEPMPPAVEAQSLNHWITRKVPQMTP